MPTRSATAVWNGSGKEGNGTVSTQSTALSNAQYSYNTRFEEGVGTNPEELVAAAHAGCFAMKLSFILGAAGHTPTRLDVTCNVTIENGKVSGSHLQLKAEVPGINKQKFDECAEEAKKTCPISQLLNTNITLEADLTA